MSDMQNMQRQLDQLQNDFRNHKHRSNGEAYVEEEAPKKPVNCGALTAHTVIFNELNKYFNPATYEVKAVLDAIQTHKLLFFPELDKLNGPTFAEDIFWAQSSMHKSQPVDHSRKVVINGNTLTIAEALEHWRRDLFESEARACRIAQLEQQLGIDDK